MRLKSLLFLLTVVSAQCMYGQTTGLPSSSKYLNLGVGASTFGIPKYLSVDLPLSMDYQFIGLGVSTQSQKEVYDFSYYYGGSYTWKVSLTGIHMSYNYDIAEFIEDMLPKEIQIYVGAQLDYYILKAKLTDHTGKPVTEYTGTETGGIGITGLAGFRYFMGEKRKLAINVVLNGGTRTIGGRIGVSYNLGEKSGQ